MRRKELEKLIGGYATGTLTERERRALFEAALTDQALFNAMADEQALKEVLADPRARRRLLQALEDRPGLFSRLGGWFWQPAFRAVAGGLAVAVLAVTTVTRLLDMTPPPSETTEDSFQTEPAPHRPSVDKLARKKQAVVAPKKTEPREPVVTETKEVRDADVKQNKDTEQQVVANVPKLEDDVTERRAEAPTPLAKAIPETKSEAPAPTTPTPGAKPDTPAGASAPSAKTVPAPPAAAPAPPQSELLARSDVSKQGARELFYGKAAQKEKDETSTGRPSTEGSQGQKAPEESGRLRAFSESASQERLGLRYSIAKPEPGSARVVVEVSHNGYLYAFFADRGEAPQLLFPNPLTKPGDAYVEKGGRYLIPSGSALPLRSDAPAQVTLVFAREPLRNLQEITASSRSLPSKNRVVREDREEPTRQGSREAVTYVVEAAPSASSSLAVEITLPPR